MELSEKQLGVVDIVVGIVLVILGAIAWGEATKIDSTSQMNVKNAGIALLVIGIIGVIGLVFTLVRIYRAKHTIQHKLWYILAAVTSIILIVCGSIMVNDAMTGTSTTQNSIKSCGITIVITGVLYFCMGIYRAVIAGRLHGTESVGASSSKFYYY